ncbi:DUF2953 domain-containing protein [Paenibacillus sp. OV219]|uniref:DUF2953 domain-containing protein n=1 Tax=Paenibacillus sp. OV219 TaxID=1884377 RepID=UPI0008D6F1B1|nr:DUF2953 domain-containing protein [Paenibacillus sp. OV219]SEN23104.1 Protein of unknown function [Paenibacillus sp. OV219]
MLGYPFGWMIGTGLFFLLLLIAALSPVVIRGHMQRIGTDDDAELRIRALFGLIHYHWQLPVVKFKLTNVEVKEEKTAENAGGADTDSLMKNINSHTIMNSIDRAQLLLKQTQDMMGWVRKTLSHVKLTEWKWQTTVGVDDAMWTAMLTGLIWSVKTTAIGVLSQFIRLTAEPNVSVDPIYQRVYFKTEGQFTAKLAFGYAIFAAIRLIFKMRKSQNIPGGFIGLQRILMRN